MGLCFCKEQPRSRALVASRPPPPPRFAGGAQSIRIQDGSGNSLRVSRRRQIVVVALDISASMTGSRISAAVRGLKEVLDGLSSMDLVAILTFNSKVEDFTGGLIQATPSNVRIIKNKLDRLDCGNATALYDAILGLTALVLNVSQQIKQVRDMSRMIDHLGQAAGVNEDLDVDLGHAWLVVISDGEDTVSKHKFEECAALLALLGKCGIDYNILWLGVQLNGEAEKKMRVLDALSGAKSEFCNVNSSGLGKKFQEIAVKIKASVG